MSDAMAAVKTAAGILDKYAKEKDWRNMVNLDRLNMMSSSCCVIGQTQPDTYGDTLNYIKSKMVGHARELQAFANHDEEWVKYIKSFQPDAEWSAAYVDSDYKIMSTFVRNDQVYVLFASDLRGVKLRKIQEFEEYWEPKKVEPKYVVGRLYHSADENIVFLYIGPVGSGTDFVRLSAFSDDSSSTSTGGSEWYERQYGPLKEINHKGNTVSAQIDS